jgi:hypothetical protein
LVACLGSRRQPRGRKFLRDPFNETINNGFTGVTATVELAAPATAIQLNPQSPPRKKGRPCTAGEDEAGQPLPRQELLHRLKLEPGEHRIHYGTDGAAAAQQSMRGAVGTISTNETQSLITISGGRLVNNSFAASGANGCGGIFSFLIDPFVDSIVGVPSAAGHNTAILEGKIQAGEAQAVQASE